MKNAFKRCAVLLMALAVLFSLSGCKKKVTVKVKESSTCGSFTVDGTLGNSGTVKITGRLPAFQGHLPRTVNNQAYTYKKSGNTVTFTRKGGLDSDGPRRVSGIYDSNANTFTVNNADYCV